MERQEDVALPGSRTLTTVKKLERGKLKYFIDKG
jgi:hypothetical protein